MGQDRTPAQECVGQGALGVAPDSPDLGRGPERLEDRRDVRGRRGLAARDADMVIVDQAQEHAAWPRLGHDRRARPGTSTTIVSKNSRWTSEKPPP